MQVCDRGHLREKEENKTDHGEHISDQHVCLHCVRREERGTGPQHKHKAGGQVDNGGRETAE